MNDIDRETGPDAGYITPASVAALSLSDFRCHRRLRLDLSPEAVVLTGNNGSGKTSILEALSMLAPGRGLRRARLAELARRGAEGSASAWAVTARVRSRLGVQDLATGWATEPGEEGGERRQLKIDGQPAASLAALAEVLPILWLTPEMDRLFAEGASVRRRFVDRLVTGLDPAHAARIQAYDRAMQQRQVLLRQGRADPGWLAAIEDRMAAAAVAIVAARREAAARLTMTCRQRPGPFPAATLESVGQIEDWLGEGPALAAEDRLRTAFAQARQSDAESGRTGAGAHKSELIVRYAATGRPAAVCSTGEQKALLIAIVLASAALQAEQLQQVPLLLLDEVAAHLDGRHRASLFDAVGDLAVQAWYAGTDRGLFQPLVGRAQFVGLEEPPAIVPVRLLPTAQRKERMTPDD